VTRPTFALSLSCFPGISCDLMFLHFLAPSLAQFRGPVPLAQILTSLPTSTLRVRRFSCHLFIPHPRCRHDPPYAFTMLGWTLYFFTYLSGFWISMKLDDPGAVNFTCKPSSIFSTPHSMRVLSSVVSPLSRLPYPLFSFHCSLPFSLPVPYYVAHTPVSCQLFFSPHPLHVDYPPHIIFTCSTTSSSTKNRLPDFARAARPYIVQRNTEGEAKRKIGTRPSYP